MLKLMEEQNEQRNLRHSKEKLKSPQIAQVREKKFLPIESLFTKINLQAAFWYEILSGNNHKLIQRVFDETFRSKFWRNIKD